MAEAAIDTRKDPARSRRLKAFWLEQARERLLGNHGSDERGCAFSCS